MQHRTTALAALIAATILAGTRCAEAQTGESPKPPGVTDGDMSQTPGPGEYSLRATTGDVLHPKRSEAAPEVFGPATWLPMKLLYTDQPPSGTDEVVAAWQLTKPELYKHSTGSAVLYQVYQTATVKALVMIGLTQKCNTPFDTSARGSKIMLCPVDVYVTSTDRPARLIEQRRGCFQWNGQSPPGSPTDPRLNSDYTLFEPDKKVITVEGITDGHPRNGCEAVFDLNPPPARDDDE